MQVPRAGEFLADPLTGNRIWRVTDPQLCPRGARHFYSYWPVWNRAGTHLVVECIGRGGAQALLLRDSDLKKAGHALKGAPAGLNTSRLFWSWTDPEALYGHRELEVWRWNPFSGKGKRVLRMEPTTLNGLSLSAVRLAYVSFEDRYLLLELQGPNPRRKKPTPWDVIGLATWDMREEKLVGLLDVSTWSFYDEAVFTPDNHVWVVSDVDSFRYDLGFEGRIRVAESGHHAHGLLSGRAVTVKAASNRDCPPGSPSGDRRHQQYPAKGWKPTAVLLDDSVDSPTPERNGPLASILFKLGCQVPGLHQFAHFSWNNWQQDHFFISSGSYGGYETDPLAHAILRVRLKVDPQGAVVGDEIEVLAQHRSEPRASYWAFPRASCNQQGTRCLFASTMTVNTDQAKARPDLYIVDVPPLRP